MSSFPDPQHKGQRGTYFVNERLDEQELQRLTIQDRIITAAMGGVLAEQPHPASFGRVLDIGCGPGGWVIEAARTYSEMHLIGIDISPRMISYAREQAAAAGVEERVEFQTMDALLIVEFPENYFDLVNLRLGVSFLRTWEWPKMLSEMLRVSRRGGVVRVTEQSLHENSSPAFAQIFAMGQCAFFRSGHLFTPTNDGFTAHLPQLLVQHGCKRVQTHPSFLTYRANTPEGRAYCDNALAAFHNVRPFIQKWGCMTGDYDALYQQARDEMAQPDFVATWNFLTAWGWKS